MGKPFGVIMSSVGVITLAGIVVNNNIVFIDTYNVLRSRGELAFDAVLRTCAIRLRPVMLTTVTTIVGLLPMVLGVNINLIDRDISIGAPSSQWWTQLASSVAGGLAFATVLTLLAHAQPAHDPGQRQRSLAESSPATAQKGSPQRHPDSEHRRNYSSRENQSKSRLRASNS